ncbi:hypothetical protein FGG78_20010 [Thioclava sp. BHET1]|nr:hypothetical protein FGG78_20010 [Thioclava sp. BHET1]
MQPEEHPNFEHRDLASLLDWVARIAVAFERDFRGDVVAVLVAYLEGDQAAIEVIERDRLLPPEGRARRSFERALQVEPLPGSVLRAFWGRATRTPVREEWEASGRADPVDPQTAQDAFAAIETLLSSPGSPFLLYACEDAERQHAKRCASNGSAADV